MLSEAISKIKAEMEGNKNNSYIQRVGGFLLQHLDTNQADAEKIMTADKTVAKSLDAMKSEARKNQVNGCGVLTDEEGFAVVLKYFGIEGADITPAQASVTVTAPAPAVNDFNVSLDDLLG